MGILPMERRVRAGGGGYFAASARALGRDAQVSHQSNRAFEVAVDDRARSALAASGGPLLFGPFTIADAYFAPVVMRVVTYGLPVPAEVAAYIERVRALPGVAAWVRDALAEHDFLAFEEPYRTQR